MKNQVVALDAIASGLGALFPTPALAVLITHELSLAAGLVLFSASYMERVTTSLAGACISWVRNSEGGRGLHLLGEEQRGWKGPAPPG